MIIDAKDLIMGRLASHVAKKLLEGQKVTVINAESAIVTGTQDAIMAKYRQRRARGERFHGPFFPRMPDRILRRTVRGMLPYTQKRGRDAFHRLKVFIGRPSALKDVEPVTVPAIDISTSNAVKYMRLGEISQLLGVARDRW
jgi:large subunit ribosomal protein L13